MHYTGEDDDAIAIVIQHLESALDAKKTDEMDYHLREALQILDTLD